MFYNQKIVLVFIGLFAYSLTARIDVEDENDRRYRAALENRDLIGGDILIDKNSRSAVNNAYYRWPGRRIPYQIAENRTDLTKGIEEAMRHIESQTCIRFVKRTIETDFVFIFKGIGCFSHVGRVGGQQNLSLGNGCELMGTIVHELTHAIGFWHHHQRVDRDQYLTIHWNNIEPKLVSNFYILNNFNSVMYTPFDYKSIMLYDSTSFSKNGYSKTMTPKQPNVILQSVWRKKYLSQRDAYSINRYYSCTN